jgi:DNA-binding HxlR family transcriptional regulator
MFSRDKNLKDSSLDTSNSLMDISFPISYTKTNKLITALYMVTDIIDREEPIKNKLRILGTEIISDIHNATLARTVLATRINEVVSFLDIASAMNFISEMNCNILKKEFLALRGSVQEYVNKKPEWLDDLLADHKSIGHAESSNGHQTRTRIGVQKGSTLLKALSDKSHLLINHNNKNSGYSAPVQSRAQGFDIVKKERRFNIIRVIKNSGGSATIKDVREKINNNLDGSVAYSEKTLQRELVSMTKDGVLEKTGEKRWSRYFIKALGN